MINTAISPSPNCAVIQDLTYCFYVCPTTCCMKCLVPTQIGSITDILAVNGMLLSGYNNTKDKSVHTEWCGHCLICFKFQIE